MSRQRPLIDTLPNAVGLKYKSSSPLPGTYARRAPQPISTPRLPPLASSPPFCFHTSPSLLPLSLTIFGDVPLAFNSLSPSCDALHAISYLFTSPSPAPRHQPVSNCVFPLPSCHLTGLSSSLPPTHSMHFPVHSHFSCATTHFPLFVLVSLLSSSFMFSPSQFIPVLKWV